MNEVKYPELKIEYSDSPFLSDVERLFRIERLKALHRNAQQLCDEDGQEIVLADHVEALIDAWTAVRVIQKSGEGNDRCFACYAKAASSPLMNLKVQQNHKQLFARWNEELHQFGLRQSHHPGYPGIEEWLQWLKLHLQACAIWRAYPGVDLEALEHWLSSEWLECCKARNERYDYPHLRVHCPQVMSATPPVVNAIIEDIRRALVQTGRERGNP